MGANFGLFVGFTVTCVLCTLSSLALSAGSSVTILCEDDLNCDDDVLRVKSYSLDRRDFRDNNLSIRTLASSNCN